MKLVTYLEWNEWAIIALYFIGFGVVVHWGFWIVAVFFFVFGALYAALTLVMARNRWAGEKVWTEDDL